jgi:plasmid maintenance system antidote protein VapI
MAAETIMGPVHPGEILLEEFLEPLSVSQYHLAKEIGVPALGAVSAPSRICVRSAARSWCR